MDSEELISQTAMEQLATGRTISLFAEDFTRSRDLLRERLDGRRVAVLGAAGSIGAAVVRALGREDLAALTLIDLSENGLAEIVRDLRSSDASVPKDFAALPIALGSRELDRYFDDHPRFDVIFNLCAIKHVRSEKDVYSLLRMLDTNVLFVDDLLRDHPPRERFFSVSTDKAARPASLMGASKALMESVLARHSETLQTTSARFANVAFSAGSLLDAFLRRLEKRQPLSAPDDVRRFFISHEEAAQLCLLAAVLGQSGDVFLPDAEIMEERPFHEIALELLQARGLQPEICASEEEARTQAEEHIRNGRWPCFFSSSDTAGEKMREIFAAADETLDRSRFQNILTTTCRMPPQFEELLDELRRRHEDGTTSREDLIDLLSRAVPSLEHLDAARNLDQKM